MNNPKPSKQCLARLREFAEWAAADPETAAISDAAIERALGRPLQPVVAPAGRKVASGARRAREETRLYWRPAPGAAAIAVPVLLPIVTRPVTARPTVEENVSTAPVIATPPMAAAGEGLSGH